VEVISTFTTTTIAVKWDLGDDPNLPAVETRADIRFKM
jgi:hypothetical protein